MERSLIEQLRGLFGRSNVTTGENDLIHYSFDKCPRYLLQKKEENIGAVVVRPDRREYAYQLAHLISLTKEYRKKIIVRGGGSGVCGAAVPRFGPDTIIVDMTSIDSVTTINEKTGYVNAGAGIMGSKLEAMLYEKGFTLGHSPASLDISTIGGWAATRSSGQFSARFGTVEDLIRGIEVIFPDGSLSWIGVGNRERLQKFLRMEGTTGFITRVEMKIFPISKFRGFRTYVFKRNSLECVATALDNLPKIRKELEQKGVFISAVRIYDAVDWGMMAKPHKNPSSKPPSGLRCRIEKILLKHIRRYCKVVDMLLGDDFSMILVLESDSQEDLKRSLTNLDSCVEDWGGERDEDDIAESWYENRFHLKIEKLEKRYEYGLIVDTFDCQAQLPCSIINIYKAVRKQVRDYGLIGAHFGMDRENLYAYFTFAGVGDERIHGIVWTKMLEACYFNGGLTTHQHGIGSHKAGWENMLSIHCYGKEWFAKAQQTKKSLDPHNVFNPNNIFTAS